MNGIKLYSVNSRRLPLGNQDQIQENGNSRFICDLGFLATVNLNYVIILWIILILVIFTYSGIHWEYLKSLEWDFQCLLYFFSLAGVFAGSGVCMFSYISHVTITKLYSLSKTHCISHPITQSHWQMMNLVHVWLFYVYFILVLFSWLNGILLCAVLSKYIYLILAYLGSHPSLELWWDIGALFFQKCL